MQKFKKVSYLILGSIFVAIGLIGIFVPVLPTTVFLLLAAFFYARSSNRALHWLLHNRWFGPYIRNYREGRGMAVRDKVVTLLLLWITITATAVFVIEDIWVRLLLFAVALGVTIHLLWIKTYRPNRDVRAHENAVETE
jgi:uncharacterized membrane protein YbaN (DUF454 family)